MKPNLTATPPTPPGYASGNLKVLLIDALVQEFENLDARETETILPWIEGIQRTGLYMYFSPLMTQDIADSILTNAELRRFLLSLSDRVEALIAISDTLRPDILTVVSKSICRSQLQKQSNESLIARDVAASITIPETDLTAIMDHNTWIVILYLCLATGAYDQTLAMFSDTFEQMTGDNRG